MITIFKILLASLLICYTAQTYGQLKISGKIFDDTGEKLPGVIIKELGTENGTVSDTCGNFVLSVSNSESIIEVLFVGYKRQEIKIGEKRYFDVKLKVDCIIDFFDYNDICLGFSSGVLNHPIGGFGYIKLPIPKIGLMYGEFDYQSDFENNYKMEIHSGLLHFVAECDYYGDIYLNYRKIVNQDFYFSNYSIISKLNLSQPRIFQNYSTFYFGYGMASLTEPDIKYINQSGYIVGLGAFIGKPLYLSISLKAIYWTNYWEYMSEIEWEYKRVLISMNYDKFKNFNELNLKLGYIFNY